MDFPKQGQCQPPPPASSFPFLPFIHLMSPVPFLHLFPSQSLLWPISLRGYVQTSKTPLCIWFDLNLSLGEKSGRCHNESAVIHLLELIGQLYNFLNRHRSRSHRYLTQIWGDQNVFLPFFVFDCFHVQTCRLFARLTGLDTESTKHSRLVIQLLSGAAGLTAWKPGYCLMFENSTCSSVKNKPKKY